MAVTLRNACDINHFGKDCDKIRTFLCSLKDPTFSFGRWDWMMKHGTLNETEISQIGVWEENGEIVAAVLWVYALRKRNVLD